MMRSKKILIFILVICLFGCVSQPQKRLTKNLKTTEGQIASVAAKFDLAKKENLNLRRELILCKKYQDIDTARFIRALPDFEKELAPDLKEGDAWVQLTDRGLVVTVSSEKLFVTGSDNLSDGGEDFLDRIAVLADKFFPHNYLYVEGHTDNQSLAVFEWKSDRDFSFARALSVLKYFTQNSHMDPWRLSASGFGQYRPRDTNETKEGRRLNRRIEIIISAQRLRHTVSR